MSSNSPTTTLWNQKLLLVGLIFHATLSDAARAAYGTPEQIEEAVRRDEARADKAGFDVTSYQIDPAKEQEGLDQFKEYLESGQYDAVMIGSGIRMVEEMTPLFETMVNMCRTIAPNKPLMFNAAPGTMTRCLERLYGASFDR